jgi:hypothetical protein
MNTIEQEELFKQILSEVLDVLEGGDVALDLPNMPGAAVTIRIIADIAGGALKNINESRELLDALQNKLGAVYNPQNPYPFEDKGVTK